MVSEPKSVIIIGSGMAGLSAGCYARMNGYQATIFERHDLPGGVVTSWKRHGYQFDGCIEFLNGSRPGTRWNRMWQELGAAQGCTFIDHGELMRVSGPNGEELAFHADPDQLEHHLLALAPEDARLIKEFVQAIRALAAFDPPLDVRPLEMMLEMPRFMGLLNTYNKYSKISLAEFARRFTNPFLRAAIPCLLPEDQIPMSTALGMLAFQASRTQGYPLGGSLAFSQAIEKRFIGMGGQIYYRTPVAKILTDPLPGGRKAKAVGVQFCDGREVSADWVISAADSHVTQYDLLEGKYLDPTLAGRFANLPLTPTSMQISLGVNRDLRGEPHSRIDLLGQPAHFAGQDHHSFWYHIFNYEPAAAPVGKTVIISRVRTNYDYWHNLGRQSERYETEKQAVADALIAHLESRYPGIRDQVEAVDVATPLTYERYTGAYRGTYQGFAATVLTAKYSASGFPAENPLLEQFFQIGSWIQPGGGVFPAAKSGREAVKKICKKDGRRFETSLPEE